METGPKLKTSPNRPEKPRIEPGQPLVLQEEWFVNYNTAACSSKIVPYEKRGLSVSLSLSHWYPGSGVVLDCIDS